MKPLRACFTSVQWSLCAVWVEIRSAWSANLPLFDIRREMDDGEKNLPAAYLAFKERRPEVLQKIAAKESLDSIIHEFDIQPIDLETAIRVSVAYLSNLVCRQLTVKLRQLAGVIVAYAIADVPDECVSKLAGWHLHRLEQFPDCGQIRTRNIR